LKGRLKAIYGLWPSLERQEDRWLSNAGSSHDSVRRLLTQLQRISRKLRPAFGLLQSITCMAPYAVQRQTLPHGRQQAHRFTRASPSRKILYARLFGPERQKPCPKHAGLQVISEGI
jgi:hypothetical protein